MAPLPPFDDNPTLTLLYYMEGLDEFLLNLTKLVESCNPEAECGSDDFLKMEAAVEVLEKNVSLLPLTAQAILLKYIRHRFTSGGNRTTAHYVAIRCLEEKFFIPKDDRYTS